MVWSETAKLGPSSTLGGTPLNPLWLARAGGVSAGKVSIRSASEDPPPETAKSPCQMQPKLTLNKVSADGWRRLPAQRLSLDQKLELVKAIRDPSARRHNAGKSNTDLRTGRNRNGVLGHFAYRRLIDACRRSPATTGAPCAAPQSIPPPATAHPGRQSPTATPAASTARASSQGGAAVPRSARDPSSRRK